MNSVTFAVLPGRFNKEKNESIFVRFEQVLIYTLFE